MPTPISYLSGNTLSYQSGMVKKGTIGLNLTSSLTGNYRWWNGVDATSSQYLIYSDTYSTGASSESNVTPAAWSTPDLTDTSLLNLINTLPDRVGQTAFTSLSNALIWLNQSGKYFLVKNGYENLVTSGLTLNLDAGWTNSYSGTTSWRDISGNGKTGTLTNGPAFNSGNTGSIYFDGTDDFCVVPSSSLNGLSSGSISVWVKFLNLNFQYVLSLPNSGVNNGFDILIENGKLDSYLQATNSAGSTGSQFVPKLGIWYNIVTTYDGTTHKLFVNGVFISSVGRSGTIQNGIGQTFLGRFSSGFGAYSNNYTSNAQLYNRALSQTEILQNYQLYKNRFGYDIVESGMVLNTNPQNYVSYSGAGTTLYDLTGNEYNGILTNGTTFDSTTNTFEFDGTDDYIEFPISYLGIPSGSTEFSISVDFNAYIISNYRGIVSFVSAGGPYGGYTISTTSAAGLDFAINLNNAWDSDNTPMSLSANTWYNVTVTFGNGQKKIYKNGTLFTTIVAPGTLQYKAGTERLRFGFNASTNSAKYFIGKIGNVAVYNRMLSANEATQNYYQGNIVTNDLVLNLDAGNLVSYGGTGTTWYDLTNTTTGATLVNGPTYNTSNGGSIVFDGTDDYVVGPSSMSISQNQPFTLEFWVNLSSYTNLYPCLLQIKTDTTHGFIVFVTQADTYDGITFGSTDTWIRLRNAGNEIVTNTWNQIVINYNGAGAGTASNYKMYLNTQEQTLSDSGSFIGLSQVNNIGTIENASRGYDNWTGRIANFKQYNRALSQSEIIQNFNAHKSRYGL
jgi:hypothetical protein